MTAMKAMFDFIFQTKLWPISEEQSLKIINKFNEEKFNNKEEKEERERTALYAIPPNYTSH